MRNIRCADCGKRYDYDVDDFCPRCGSFNPPPDSGATRLEEELLSRFQQPAGGRRTTEKKVRTVSYHPSYNRGPEKRKKKSGIRILAAVLILVSLFVWLQPLLEFVTGILTDVAYGLLP